MADGTRVTCEDLATGETVDWIYTDGWLDQILSNEGGPL